MLQVMTTCTWACVTSPAWRACGPLQPSTSAAAGRCTCWSTTPACWWACMQRNAVLSCRQRLSCNRFGQNSTMGAVKSSWRCCCAAVQHGQVNVSGWVGAELCDQHAWGLPSDTTAGAGAQALSALPSHLRLVRRHVHRCSPNDYTVI